MADMSWMSALVSGGGGGSGGTTDYDQLSNRPVTNLTGNGIVISTLPSGVYNIAGTWKITADDEERASDNDDLFYVLNTDTESKLTWISAGQIKTFGVSAGGSAEDITETETATVEEVADQLVGDF